MKEDKKILKSEIFIEMRQVDFHLLSYPPIFFIFISLFFLLLEKKILLAHNSVYERKKTGTEQKIGKKCVLRTRRRVFISPLRGTNKQEKKLKIVLVNEKERRRFLSVPL